MTICIGMLATDGIVIAADAQESDQYYKRSQQKIFSYLGNVSLGNNPDPPSMGCAFTGAGDAGYLDAFFAYAMQGIDTKATQAAFETFLADKLYSFHERHIFPLAAASNPPEIQVLVGAHVHWQTCMFVSHGSTIRRAFPHAAVGAGAHFALGIMGDIGGVPRDLKHMELTAAYVLALTKESIEGCGKYTAIVSIHNSRVEDTPGEPSRMIRPQHPLTHVSGKKIRRWEESFGARWGPRQTRLINELIEEELEKDAPEETK